MFDERSFSQESFSITSFFMSVVATVGGWITLARRRLRR